MIRSKEKESLVTREKIRARAVRSEFGDGTRCHKLMRTIYQIEVEDTKSEVSIEKYRKQLDVD